MTTPQGYININDLNFYFSNKAVILISKLKKSRHSFNGTLAYQKLHFERKTHGHVANIWTGLFHCSAFRGTRQWLPGLCRRSSQWHDKSKYSKQNPIYNVLLSHKFRYAIIKSCQSHITPLWVLCMGSTGSRCRCQSCPQYTSHNAQFWNLHHLVNKLLLILRNRHRTLGCVRRHIW